ncbi:MAG: hypothetical protein H6744_20310 [Deltaproteobacteria bacterium]|nr:hypothetical protein [Deltaproteobacteria bacterium]
MSPQTHLATRRELAQLLAETAPEPAARHAAALLRQAVHDLNSPLSSLSLELFNLGESGNRISAALGGAVPPTVRVELSEIEDICANLLQAQNNAVAVLTELREIAHELERSA